MILYTKLLCKHLRASRPVDRRTFSSLGEYIDSADVEEAESKSDRLIPHIFRWGVGNRHVAQSKNRYRPTHKERNTTVSIRANYFELDLTFEKCKIVYDETNEHWEVLWHEHGKLNGKPFPIKKYGIEASKIEAISFAKTLNERLKSQPDPDDLEQDIHGNIASSQGVEKGVTFDRILQSWVGLGRVGTRPTARAFSADYHGYENAKHMAKTFKNE
ncbi:hypothetical protein BEWA_022220 [Theileria equi strain WA]|uniref:Uncharacterized protein n=1 Tax=Theileria equi strain WA TaxID=1537102 RepID=L0AWV3_THEEQ|nr:hypothetical protein BEWA_022220 [Theileria equi strain WA]AFZ79374.1 hypothetical protein BEWA_022220 [Theileria equi strain WA]|eukprot:XP_004829040.1 hypothetical protein BEWA_022220 [Theileria equi strain WA]